MAYPPIAQRPSGVTAWRLNRRYTISTSGTAQQAGLGADRKVQKFLVRHYNKNVPQCPSGLGSYINSRASLPGAFPYAVKEGEPDGIDAKTEDICR